MGHRKLLAGVAVAAALGAGAMIGIVFGVPTLSGAQTPAPSSSPAPLPGKGPHGLFALKGGFSLDVAAKDLAMTTADLKKALGGGQSIAALARSKNVDPQKIINDMVADATTRIDAAASAGKITAAQATNLKNRVTAAIGAFVNQTRPSKPPGVTGTVMPVFGLKPSLATAAKDLNMTTADLQTALRGGQSIAALARSKNVDPQKIINDLVAEATTRIDAAASAGKITAAQATNLKNRVTAAIGAFVNGNLPGRGGFRVGPWGPGGPFGPFGPFGGPGGPGKGGHRPTSTATSASI